MSSGQYQLQGAVPGMSMARQQLLGLSGNGSMPNGPASLSAVGGGAGQHRHGSSGSGTSRPQQPTQQVGSTATRDRDLEALSTAELEAALTDEGALKALITRFVENVPAARTVAEIKAQNVAIAQESLAMQGLIDEARTHVAIVRSSEYATAKDVFEELVSRQNAVLEKINPSLLMEQLRQAADAADVKSGDVAEQFYDGKLPLDQFVEQYCSQRSGFHMLDLKRQAAESTMYR